MTNAVWNAMINEVQGVYVAPVDIALPATRYDMGRAVGTFEEEPEATVVEAAPVAKANKPAAERKGTKAEVVREMIREAKEENVELAAVVAKVVEQLGMTRALANAYVKNNWDKA